ncbi:phosphoenolpyruvate carboxykinase (GTP) [Pendulispora brunnea]|uniref:Phosphoenolpyruvate carboxykinase [GTP] n=1 Tax=Pendulispora brunnea TaxID=2905690 RepID=A0ABZ2KIR9_9BACT
MRNEELHAWVKKVAEHTKPDAVRWCDGTPLEARALEDRMVASGELVRLNERFPHSFLHRTDPMDGEDGNRVSVICTKYEDDAGPTNEWMSPEDAERTVWPRYDGIMRGRTMYVVPYLLGPAHSSHGRIGVQITDSAYVAASLGIMTRVGQLAIRQLGPNPHFVKGLHSVGDLSPHRRFVFHFPQTKTIWSLGSEYATNAILSKECHALRLASAEACEEGWMAEHMTVFGLTSPSGVTRYIAAAFPNGCGKTNLAMLTPGLPGWKVETIGDDICWMHVGDDGRLWALNPLAGFFGVAPGTNPKTHRNVLAAMARHVLFTNTALRADGSPWWEGLEPVPNGETLIDWRGKAWTSKNSSPAAHPNARFAVSARRCPTVGPSFDAPNGVPISAILFGGRRSKLVPLVFETHDWAHGVYTGATLVSETPIAENGSGGMPSNDPMAMLPFCGINMGEYFRHWLRIGERLTRPPRIFQVNWFRTDDEGKLLWPGFGENIRVLEWILERVEGRGHAIETPLGRIPTRTDLNLAGLDMSPDRFEELMDVEPRAWLDEALRNEPFLHQFGPRWPERLEQEHRAFIARLRSALQ